MKNVSKNFIYNLIYQVFIFIIPLISTPYISRALGVDNIGIYSYTYSIVSYFMLIALLGINNHGARTIAKAQDDKRERSKNFFSIYAIQFTLSAVMLICYVLFILLSKSEYRLYLIIQGLFLISSLFDINWFFFGLEKFKVTITRNMIIKVLSLILIFVIVKNNGDLWKYCLIMSLSTLISQMYLWLFLRKEITKVHIKYADIKEHIKPCIILFIPVVAYSIYRVMDKTILGLLATTYELGFYESAEKILNIPISIYTALGTVMLPYMSKNDDNFLTKMNFSFQLCFFTVIPILLGIFIVSEDFTIVYFGKEYLKTAYIIRLLIPSILFSSIANVIRTNYLIPKKMDNIYIISTISGAFINLIFNLALIPNFGAYGACVGTIAAELSVLVYQIIKVHNSIPIINIVKILMNFLIKAAIMGGAIYCLGQLIDQTIIKLLMQIILGVIVYLILNIKFIKNLLLSNNQI